jgi:hypothetical protein
VRVTERSESYRTKGELQSEGRVAERRESYRTKGELELYGYEVVIHIPSHCIPPAVLHNTSHHVTWHYTTFKIHHNTLHQLQQWHITLHQIIAVTPHHSRYESYHSSYTTSRTFEVAAPEVGMFCGVRKEHSTAFFNALVVQKTNKIQHTSACINTCIHNNTHSHTHIIAIAPLLVEHFYTQSHIYISWQGAIK